ncbi:hypothetical protein UFOVP51_72 [uncultured Caudovirales phage]|uniref:Uncharacterized protein n=1 Tax=uncultured Caudovirales phage TaxID=2100421 RepID=A0A6J5TAI5_9CAUD|nr:hypothetical protein UFOVP51_72 [uncultured Caudovirales phage]CAB4240864.1 hypothetical protein UFOVP34_34 [uncultured Caudovirales phage]
MSTYTKLTWPVQDVAAVCALQNVAAPGALLLNGTLFNSSIPGQVSFVRVNIIRSISLTSVNNLSATNFVIQGFQNGAFVTETLAGPNNNTVYGTQIYDIIISVIASTAVTGIQVGTGKVGFLPLLVINPNAGFINYSMEIDIPTSPASGINYSVIKTLAQVSINYITFSNQLTKFFPVAANLTSQTTSQTGNSILITNFILLQVNSSSSPITDTFDFIFLQE